MFERFAHPRRQVWPYALAAVAAFLAGLGAYQIVTWPDVAPLATQNPRRTAFIDRYQEEQRRLGKSDRILWRWVPYDSIAPNLKRAVVVSEDIGFFSHSGFDLT